MIIRLVGSGKLPVVVVDLSRCGEVALRVEIESQLLVRVRVLGQPGPVRGVKPSWILSERSGFIHGLIARRHAPPKEAVASAVGGKLIITVKIAIADSLGKSSGDIVKIRDLDHAAYLDPRSQPETDGRDHTQESVAADCQT